jgi:hypothetical protein
LRQHGFSFEEIENRDFDEVLWYAITLNEGDEEQSYRLQAEALAGDRPLVQVEE